jgi:ABC-type polysaccharide/polyol phosphate transport system ATPase subunit
MLSDVEPALVLNDVSKRFFLNPKRPWKLADALFRPASFARQVWSRDSFWAVRDLSLVVGRGEFVGIVGENGSGKSTLLRLMAGISLPTRGTVQRNGRVAALLEVTAGFHPLATGRENVLINALLMGLSKREIMEKVPESIRFAEMEEFVDQPVRTYSAGMSLRLGFSVAVHVRPDILLVDEVIAVGDAAFREKCFNHFEMLKRDGVTIVLVSHDIESIVRFSDRAFFLDRGMVAEVGEPKAIVETYFARLVEKSPELRDRLEEAVLKARQISQAG